MNKETKVTLDMIYKTMLTLPSKEDTSKLQESLNEKKRWNSTGARQQ